jgi:hypothetical protein
MHVWIQRWTAIVLLCLGTACGTAGEDYAVVPFDVDPPLVVDGDFGDWANVPNAFALDQRQQVSDGVGTWTGPADLSGRVRLAWRDTGLFVAAEVSDETLSQTCSGRDLWKGDHVSVLFDLVPGVAPERSAFGAGQAHLGFSPGAPGATPGDTALRPEIFIWAPSGATQGGGQIVARRTDTGYALEAFVPWAALNLPPMTMNQDANFEVALSDSDSLPSTQETWMTFGTQPWQRVRSRLLPLVFGDGNGKAPAPVRGAPLAAALEVPVVAGASLTFQAPALAVGKDPFIFFNARLQRPKVAGYSARSLALEVNGQRVSGERLANRPRNSVTLGGREATFIAPDGAMTIPYTPKAEDFDSHPQYSLINGVKGCEFEFNLAGLLKEGENTLTFVNLCDRGLQGDYTVHLEKLELRLKAHVEKIVSYRPAPSGELPVCVPQATFPKAYADLTQAAGEIRFRVGSDAFVVKSEFSAPDGKLYPGTSPFYSHVRQVIEHDEWIEVRDTLRNLTQEPVPVIHAHTCAAGATAKDVYLCGVRLPSGAGQMAVAEQPSAFLATATSGVGLLIQDDVFRVHGEQSAAAGTIRISDRHFVLKAGGDYTFEWAIVPVKRPDVWDFTNAARRLLDVNFRMEIMSAFLDYRKPVTEWTDEQYRRYLDGKSANAVSDGLYCAKWQGRQPQGLAFQELVKDPKNAAFYAAAHGRIRQAFPDGRVKYAIYYHCFIDVMDESVERYKDAQRLDAAGHHMSYSLEHYKLYVPTLENAFGKEIGKGIDLRLDTLGANAFYWDEYNQSRGDYTYTPGMWDGCSGDIDGKTYKLLRPKTAVHLICLPFLEYHMKRIKERGVPAFYNGAPMSRTLARLQFQAFTETGSITNCHRMLLYTPVALGDHLTERSEEDAYAQMLRALDWGCLYAWYSRTVFPTHKTLTEHMFPATPIELREGYLIARERIVTNRSGLFGWDDASEFTAFVYDREGKATDGKEAQPLRRDGKTYAEVRLPEGYSCAIVRAAP